MVIHDGTLHWSLQQQLRLMNSLYYMYSSWSLGSAKLHVHVSLCFLHSQIPKGEKLHVAFLSSFHTYPCACNNGCGFDVIYR